MTRAPRHIIKDLEAALEAAKMTRANFNSTRPSDIDGVNRDQFIKDATRDYREAWIISRIESVLAWAKASPNPGGK